MNRTFKKALSALLVSSMIASGGVAQLTSALPSFADEKKIPDKVLFETSFEKEDGKNLLDSTLDGNHLQGVIQGKPATGGGEGLAVDYDSVSGSEDYQGSECKFNLFDGKTGTKFLTNGSPAVVIFALEESAVVRSYSICSANDVPGRDPSAFTLYGSADGKSWVQLDKRSSVSFPGRMQSMTFGFENTVSYKWYKFEVNKNAGESLTQFSGLDLFGESYDDGGAGIVDGDVTVGQVESFDGTKDLNDSEVKANLFDGATGTKWIADGGQDVWVSVKLTAPLAVNCYEITVCNDHHKRDPQSWKLYGSTDGENWVLLDSKEGQTFEKFFQTNSYQIDNETAYQYYKLGDICHVSPDNLGFVITHISEFVLKNVPEGVDVGGDEEEEAPAIPVIPESVQGFGEPYAGEGFENLIDGDIATKLCSKYNGSLWVSVQLQTPTAATAYKLATYAEDVAARDPKDFNLYGSLDGVTWVLLDARTDVKMPGRGQYYTFNFDNTVAYGYYKLELTANNGVDPFGLDVFQLAEWELGFKSADAEEEEPKEENEKVEIDRSTVTGTEDLGGGESKANLFDGSFETKMVARGKTFTVSFALKQAAVIKGYAITSANDHLTRSPKSWILYGSTDGTTYTKIDAQTGILFEQVFEEKIFGIANDKEYLYYKLEVTENDGNEYTQFSELALFTKIDESFLPEQIPGMVTEQTFGPISTECNAPGAWSGFKCLGVYGEQTATDKTYARNVIYKDLSIPVTENTRLSYVIFPGLYNIHAYDYEYTSCRVVIDLKFTDGTYLSELGAKDQYGALMTPQGQVDGEALYTAQWNYVESCIGEVAKGKTIEKICVYFDMENAKDASKFITFFDDLKIEDKEEVTYEHLSDYINILRGTNNDIAFSRGMCTPGVTMPGGFNFLTPVNNPQAATLPYTYQINRGSQPLDSITITHAPNFWIGSYGSFQFMANTSVDTSAGTTGVTSTQISSQNRGAAYAHADEKASAHLYSVKLAEGSAASGVQIEVTPTLHGAYVRFTFPKNAENVNVIFDSMWGSGGLTLNKDKKTFDVKTSHGVNMFVHGEFDTEYASAKATGGAKGIVSFPEGTTVVTMKLATSFISKNQSIKNMEQEIASTDTFDTIFAKAQKEWDDLCGKFEIEGASYHELVSFYSSLYRMYAFPSLYSENEGTNESPSWVYSSPYTGRKTKGLLYTNNGFWDTYRTAWPGYSLFTAERAGDYVDGMVQHYKESGWVPRWLGPGPVNCMVGTSSDVIFADAYIKGIEFDHKAAFESMIRSASSVSTSMAAAGRKLNNTAPYKGYIANDNPVTGEGVGEGFSSSIEGYINDYGIYKMAKAMGLEAEAEYYLNRCKNYVLLFNDKAKFFMGKSSAGVWSSVNFNPAAWGGDHGDFTESVGWVNAFPAVFDGQGMVNLYGSPEELAKKLDKLFDDSYEGMKNVVEFYSVHHEVSEFKEVKMGQYMHNNQPSHHVIYTYAFSSTPYKVQEYVREVLRHVYVGSEIGQGYPGDEDNGEMSAWYVFNALGFYPYSVASGEYMIGSPLFDKVTVHLDNGKDIVIVANNNSDENVYIQSAKVNGESYNKMFLTHEQLTSGCTIEFEMGSKPSTWGSAADSKPTSLTAVGEKTKPGLSDISKGCKVNGIDSVVPLFDDNSLTSTTIKDGATVRFDSGSSKVSLITLTSGDKTKAPTSMTLKVSNDGKEWVTLLKEQKIEWAFDNFIQPIAIDKALRGSYRYYEVTLNGGTELAEIEFLGEKISDQVDPLPNPDDPTPTPSNPDDPSAGDPSSDPSASTSTPQTSEPQGGEDEGGNGATVGIIIAVVVVAVLAAGAIVFVVLKKKKA